MTFAGNNASSRWTIELEFRQGDSREGDSREGEAPAELNSNKSIAEIQNVAPRLPVPVRYGRQWLGRSLALPLCRDFIAHKRLCRTQIDHLLQSRTRRIESC